MGKSTKIESKFLATGMIIIISVFATSFKGNAYKEPLHNIKYSSLFSGTINSYKYGHNPTYKKLIAKLPLLKRMNEGVSSKHSESLYFNTSINKASDLWYISSSKDPMTGDVSYYLHSETVGSIEEMSFPYNNVQSTLIIACGANDVWDYVWFSEMNVTGGSYSFGSYYEYKERVRFDDDIQTATMLAKSASHFLSFKYDDWLIRELKNTNLFMIELEWYGDGTVHFKYNVTGFNSAYKKLISKCNKL